MIFVENKSKRKLFIAGHYLPNLPNEKHGISIYYQHDELTAFSSATYYKKKKEKRWVNVWVEIWPFLPIR